MLWITSLLLFLSLQTISATLLEDLQHVTAAPAKPPATRRCKPDCSGPADEGLKVENPNDCHQYYICINLEAIGPLDCPDSEYFDAAIKACVTNGPEECTPTCGGAGGSCAYECGGDPYVADRYDCSTYHDCASGAVMHCGQQTPYFDGETCQTEEKFCCHCNPYCYRNDINTLVPDPTDCTKYYFCEAPNEIPTTSGHCSSGNFDLLSQECSLTVPCITFCTNVVKPDGCIDVFTCKEVGSFPACVDRCTPQYYHCSAGDIGSVVAANSCNGENVFDPKKNSCVKPSECSIKEMTW
ncbi:proprotein convertase subtilisin/kexin type 5-like isoform X3 [Scylla paramamosain]|uniref:proprotein convertase subtilisin/kexin type 5-like isoform X3 n=1 Tax=Scylla paramamosain TaxID=85552 RepID=UPI0030835465